MLDRVKFVAGLFGFAFVLVVIVSNEIPFLLAGWCLCIYICWRAFPAVRSDLGRLRGRLFPDNSWRF